MLSVHNTSVKNAAIAAEYLNLRTRSNTTRNFIEDFYVYFKDPVFIGYLVHYLDSDNQSLLLSYLGK